MKILFQQPQDYNFKEIENYKGYIIYEYKSILGDMRIRYTFWYGINPFEYVSSKETIDDTKETIDRFIEKDKR